MMRERFPLVEPIVYDDPAFYFASLNSPNSVWLDSAQVQESVGRFSYLSVDPFKRLILKNSVSFEDKKQSPFFVLQSLLKKFQLKKIPELPSFQGGIAGFFSYDLGWHLEKLPHYAVDDLKFEHWNLAVYDLVLAFDHSQQKAWVFSCGFPMLEESQRLKRAKARIVWLKMLLQQQKKPQPQFTPIHDKNICASQSKKTYKKLIEKTQEYILAGDIFEANITQRFFAPFQEQEAYALYTQLRGRNPAPFGAFLNFQETKIASASPERFLKVCNNKVETRPIKGTRKRCLTDKKLDTKIADSLMGSVKDQAENVMIVDLMRNDLSKVCKPFSVKVPHLCKLETYATVHHLVSVVEGELKEDQNAVSLLHACFPGGSITGAPKIRAMEIIEELEGYKRGPYCGSIGFLAFNGDMDLSITIRTFAIKNNTITFAAGGAVVVDSDPEAEYEESLAKADVLRKVLTGKF